MYNTETAVLFNSVFYVLINLIMTDKNKRDTFYKKKFKPKQFPVNELVRKES